MDKRKEQPNSPENLLLSLEARGPLPDDGYLHLGALFEHGRRHLEGRDLVLVNPVTHRPRLKFRRTPLGMLPQTVLGVLGVEDLFADSLLSQARPRCERCGTLTERSDTIDPASWPPHGYVAAVVDGFTEDLSLEEQCELLGVERAVVDGKLVRVDDVDGRVGEPVFNLVETSRAEELVREVESWFARGGGPLRLVHFASRDAVGADLRRVFRDWRCVPCGATFPVATRQMIESAPTCPRCRGEGWLVVDDERFVACEECDAYGCVTPIRSRELAGVRLQEMATRSIAEIARSLPEEIQRPFARLLSSPLAEYPFGAAADLLSKGERIRFSIAAAEMSKISDLTLLVDVGAIGATAGEFEAIAPTDSNVVVAAASPEVREVPAIKGAGSERGVLTLRDLSIGPLSLPALSIPRGEVTLIQGEVGSGKTLLLREIARRFAKRRKLSHLAAFGNIKRCHLISSAESVARTVGELLGIEGYVASEMARLRGAQERGLVEEDFLLPHSKYLCSECGGVPRSTDEVCGACHGSLFDSRIGSVKVGSRSFAEIATLPVSELGKVFWTNDAIVGLVERLPEPLRELTLAASCAGIAPAVRRFLAVFSPLAKSLASKGGLAAELFLIDVPFGTSSAYQELILSCMRELVEQGVTIVCAGAPVALEKAFSSVVRLRTVVKDPKSRAEGRHFDTRMARRSELYTKQ